MTLLERWDRGWMEGPSAKEEIRRALAIAQAVEEWQTELGATEEQKAQSIIMRRADELLRGEP